MSLTLSDFRLAFGEQVFFDNFNLEVHGGEIVTIMGPSGSGKSSLLACIAGVMAPEFTCSGVVKLNGVDLESLPPEKRRVGMLFQDDLLFPHMSVGANLAFALPLGANQAERRARVAKALAVAGLSGYEKRDPATLSGGQRARVALMRCLLAEPQAVLLDEPFGRLDAKLRDRVRKFVFDHVRETMVPTLLVTHDMADADATGGRVIAIDESMVESSMA